MKRASFVLLALTVAFALFQPGLPSPAGASAIVEDLPVSEEEPAAPRKLVALTFDDGPSAYTEELLDGLAERGARATFFLMANKIGDHNAELIRRMDREGHTVASHTYSHPRLHLLTDEEIAREIAMADLTLRTLTGKTPALLRPPYGNFTSRVQAQIDKPFILWSVDPEDWVPDRDVGELIVFILQHTQDGDIILMHELSRTSVVAALVAVDELQARGYEFVTVPELFAAKGIELRPGSYYWSTNDKSRWERPIYDKDDPYLEQ